MQHIIEDATDKDKASASTPHTVSTEEARKYTRDIIKNLSDGIIPVYNMNLVGTFKPIVDLLLEDYDSNDLTGFSGVLEAVKSKYPEVRKLVEEEEKQDTDFTTSMAGKPIFKSLSVLDVLAQPDIEWLVAGVLQASTTTLVVGTGNVGKTFVWLDCCFDIATGRNWLGRRTKQGRVLYIYAEGRGGLKQRVQALLKERGMVDAEWNLLEPLDNIHFIPRPVHLLNDRQLLFDTIEALPSIPEEVVIDTFSMCASGVEENSNSQVAMYLATASEIKLKYGCHVTIVHHTNKSGGFRGASALRDNVDTMIALDREDDSAPIRMTAEKQRDGGYFTPFELWLKVVEIGTHVYTGDPITSCVVTMDSSEASTRVDDKQESALPEKQQKMLDILCVRGELASGTWQKECFDGFGIAKGTFYNYVERLIYIGRVAKSERLVGKQNRTYYSYLSPIVIEQQEMGME